MMIGSRLLERKNQSLSRVIRLLQPPLPRQAGHKVRGRWRHFLPLWLHCLLHGRCNHSSCDHQSHGRRAFSKADSRRPAIFHIMLVCTFRLRRPPTEMPLSMILTKSPTPWAVPRDQLRWVSIRDTCVVCHVSFDCARCQLRRWAEKKVSQVVATISGAPTSDLW